MACFHFVKLFFELRCKKCHASTPDFDLDRLFVHTYIVVVRNNKRGMGGMQAGRMDGWKSVS